MRQGVAGTPAFARRRTQRHYLWARPALVANKTRAMELQAGKPQSKGNQRGPAYAYSVKTLRDQEMQIAEQAERNYARFVDRWKVRPRKNRREGARVPQTGKA